jgi:hypothetical protein
MLVALCALAFCAIAGTGQAHAGDCPEKLQWNRADWELTILRSLDTILKRRPEFRQSLLITDGTCGYDAKAGAALAKAAQSRAGDGAPQGLCFSAASEAISRWSRDKLTIHVGPECGAKDSAAAVFENDDHPAANWFTRIAIAPSDIEIGALPPGAVIIYSNPVPSAWSHKRGCGTNFTKTSCFEVAKKYGHIDIVGADRIHGLSDGKELIKIALRQWSMYRVYLPNNAQRGGYGPRAKEICDPDSGLLLGSGAYLANGSNTARITPSTVLPSASRATNE